MAPTNKIEKIEESSSLVNGTRILVLAATAATAAIDLPHNYPKEGLLAVYTHKSSTSNSNDNEDLKICICTGVSTFSGNIDLSEVKLHNDDRSQLVTYLLQDGSQRPTIPILFEYSSENCIQITIKQKLLSGLMKISYSSTLHKEESSSSSSSSSLGFLRSLGDSLNNAQSKIRQQGQTIEKLKQDVHEWKDTAQKLDVQTWQGQKDQLVQNFLTLFHSAQEKHQKQVVELKEELQTYKDTGKRRGGTTTALQLLVDVPDDLDEPNKEPIPLSEAAILAAGQRMTKPKARTPILDPSEALSAADIKAQAQQYTKERNQSTKGNSNNTAAKRIKTEKTTAHCDALAKKESNMSYTTNNDGATKPSIKMKSNSDEESDDEALFQRVRSKPPPASGRATSRIKKEDNKRPMQGRGEESDSESDDEALRRMIREKLKRSKAEDSDDSF
jgi:hypothetical protein